MADIDFPPDLLALERSAWAAIQAGELTVETARAVQDGINAFAEQAQLPRLDVEMGLKKVVRHAAEAA